MEKETSKKFAFMLDSAVNFIGYFIFSAFLVFFVTCAFIVTRK